MRRRRNSCRVRGPFPPPSVTQSADWQSIAWDKNPIQGIIDWLAATGFFGRYIILRPKNSSFKFEAKLQYFPLEKPTASAA